MYNSYEIAERIKILTKQKNFTVKDLLEKCDLGKNTISKMSAGTDILTKNMVKIADFLECPVDYLLGRSPIQSDDMFGINDASSKYSQLNEIGKQKADEYIEDLLKLDEYRKETKTFPKEESFKMVAFGGDAEESEPPIEEVTT